MLRRSTRLARFLAAWVLLWFAVMTAAPFVPVAQELPDCSASGVHAGHQGHEAGHACDAHEVGGVHAAHANGGSGAAGHCPVCLHAAAPPPPLSGAGFAGVAPGPLLLAPRTAPLRVRTAAPPPGRGPPRLS